LAEGGGHGFEEGFPEGPLVFFGFGGEDAKGEGIGGGGGVGGGGAGAGSEGEGEEGNGGVER